MRQSIKQTILGLTLVSLVWGHGTLGHAAPLTFFGEDAGLGETTRLTSHPNADTAQTDFLSNLTGVGTEDFEGFNDGDQVPLFINFPGAGTATLTGGGDILEVPSGTNGAGRFPISGDKYLETNTFEFYVEFSSPVAAFGFYGIDIGDFNGQIELELVSGASTTLTIPHTVNGTGGSVIYYGIIDANNPFTKITFTNSGSGADVFGFDDLTIGSTEQVTITPTPPTATPEPGTMALLATGLFGLFGYCWRRHQQTA